MSHTKIWDKLALFVEWRRYVLVPERGSQAVSRIHQARGCVTKFRISRFEMALISDYLELHNPPSPRRPRNFTTRYLGADPFRYGSYSVIRLRFYRYFLKIGVMDGLTPPSFAFGPNKKFAVSYWPVYPVGGPAPIPSIHFQLPPNPAFCASRHFMP